MTELSEFINFKRRIEAARDAFESGDCREDYSTICREWVGKIVDLLDDLESAARTEFLASLAEAEGETAGLVTASVKREKAQELFRRFEEG